MYTTHGKNSEWVHIVRFRTLPFFSSMTKKTLLELDKFE
jgi:hypothetical protein